MAVDDLPRFEVALRADSPTLALRSTVESLLGEGWGRNGLLETLEAYRRDLRRSGRSRDEDVVLEVMDFLTGWSSPHVAL